MRFEGSLGQGSPADVLLDPLFNAIEQRSELFLERIRPVFVTYLSESIREAVTPGRAIAMIGAVGIVAGLTVVGVLAMQRRRMR